MENKKSKTKTFQELYEEVQSDFSAQPKVGTDDGLESELDSELNGEEGSEDITVTIPGHLVASFLEIADLLRGDAENELADVGDDLSGEDESHYEQESTEEDDEDKEKVEEANECIDGESSKLPLKTNDGRGSKSAVSLKTGKHGQAKTTPNSGDKKVGVPKIDGKIANAVPAPGKDFLQKK